MTDISISRISAILTKSSWNALKSSGDGTNANNTALSCDEDKGSFGSDTERWCCSILESGSPWYSGIGSLARDIDGNDLFLKSGGDQFLDA